MTVTGRDGGAVLYGEQTPEQTLKLSATRDTLPQGSASDWPSEKLRSEQIDVARHFRSVADIEQQMRIAAGMSWTACTCAWPTTRRSGYGARPSRGQRGVHALRPEAGLQLPRHRDQRLRRRHTAPAAGAPQPALTLPYVNYANQRWNKTAYLYVNSAPLTPGKTVASVTLREREQPARLRRRGGLTH